MARQLLFPFFANTFIGINQHVTVLVATPRRPSGVGT